MFGGIVSLFRKRRKRRLADSSDHWKAGDRALCVKDGWISFLTGDVVPGPQRGCEYLVADVEVDQIQWLRFIGEKQYWQSAGFVKIEPPAECALDRAARGKKATKRRERELT